MRKGGEFSSRETGARFQNGSLKEYLIYDAFKDRIRPSETVTQTLVIVNILSGHWG
jgi:hypothetical protein